MEAQTKTTTETTDKSHGKTDSFTNSAEKVPKKFGNKRLMHYRAIPDKALELGWLVSEGKMPEASMYAQILTEIEHFNPRREQPRFVQHGRVCWPFKMDGLGARLWSSPSRGVKGNSHKERDKPPPLRGGGDCHLL